MKEVAGGWVYILADQQRGKLYIGVTSNLTQRMQQHQLGGRGEYAHKHKLNTLVWAEHYPATTEAITREKQLKKWKRVWKLDLVEAVNPEWRDLAAEL